MPSRSFTRTRSAGLLIAALAALSATGTARADAKPGGVSGKVVDAAGRANEGVKVTVVKGDKELGTAYTDSDGKFTVDNVPPGSGYAVVAVRALRGLSMSGKKEGLTVKAGKKTDAGSIQIQVGGAGDGE